MPICRDLDLAHWEGQMRPQVYLWVGAAESGVPDEHLQINRHLSQLTLFGKPLGGPPS